MTDDHACLCLDVSPSPEYGFLNINTNTNLYLCLHLYSKWPCMFRFGSESVRPWWYIVFVCICIYICICICVTRWVRSEWLMTMPASLWMGASQTLLTSVLGVRDAIFTTNVWEELLTSVWKSGTSLRFYILAQPTPLWCYVSFEKARSPLYAWINLNLFVFGVMLSFWPMSFISLPPEGVMIRWQEKHIWLWWHPGNLATNLMAPWQPLPQETEMVDGCLLRQLCRKCRHIKIFTGWISGGQ